MTTRTLDYAGQLPRELARSEAITAAQPDRFAPLRAVGEALSRRGLAAAKCELANAALTAFVAILFDQDADGATPNMDGDGRILIPAPFGRAGGALWKLRATEQRALNTAMRRRSEAEQSPLFVYDPAARAWLLGRDYNRRSSAQAYLRLSPITLVEWRHAWAATRSKWARQNLGND